MRGGRGGMGGGGMGGQAAARKLLESHDIDIDRIEGTGEPTPVEVPGSSR